MSGEDANDRENEKGLPTTKYITKEETNRLCAKWNCGDDFGDQEMDAFTEALNLAEDIMKERDAVIRQLASLRSALEEERKKSQRGALAGNSLLDASFDLAGQVDEWKAKFEAAREVAVVWAEKWAGTVGWSDPSLPSEIIDYQIAGKTAEKK